MQAGDDTAAINGFLPGPVDVVGGPGAPDVLVPVRTRILVVTDSMGAREAFNAVPSWWLPPIGLAELGDDILLDSLSYSTSTVRVPVLANDGADRDRTEYGEQSDEHDESNEHGPPLSLWRNGGDHK
ncbi:MAG TPA: hypothetical protein VHZ97_28990 [Pseudonocardiaceae bacterium]|nr:hypothetical protein [Pseudonocardiaceae bacterium]